MIEFTKEDWDDIGNMLRNYDQRTAKRLAVKKYFKSFCILPKCDEWPLYKVIYHSDKGNTIDYFCEGHLPKKLEGVLFLQINVGYLIKQ